MASNTFKGYRLTLTLYKDGEAVKTKQEGGKSESVKFSFINKTETSIKFTREGSADAEDYGMANLSSLDYHKMLYSPNVLNATLEFSGDNSRDKLFSVAALISGAQATLEVIDITEVESSEGYKYSQSEKGKEICEGYVIYEVKPHFSSAASKKMYMEIVAYSPDKALDNFEFSKAYTGRSLGSDILKNAVKSIMPTNQVKTDISGMRVLKAAGSNENDLIQPYLVQYNETFYSFLSRIANRCGEFLYYEGGSLHLGAKPGDTEYTLSDFDKISFSVNKADDARTSGISARYNYMQKGGKLATMRWNAEKQTFEIPEDDFIFNSETGSDEYLESVKKDEFTSLGKEFNYLGDGAPGTLATLFTHTMGAGLFLGGVELAMEWLYYAREAANSINDKFNDKYFKDKDSTELRLYSGEDISDRDEKYANLRNSLYTAVYAAEQEVSRNLLHCEVTSDLSKAFSLGDTFSVETANGAGGKNEIIKYIVTDIRARFEVIAEGGRTRISQPVEITAAPYLQALGSSDSEETANLLFIPPLSVQSVRKIQPQQAEVTDIDDPAGLGRVRVRFCWQKDTGDWSPWLRVAGMMANHNGGAAYFKAAKRDNVLIDFENGNADKPFVAGFLPVVDQQFHKGQYMSRSNSVVVSSENGQMMLMKDDEPSVINGLAWAAQLPGLFIPGLPSLDSTSEEGRKRYYGSTEFKDYYGIYSLKMSSTDKSISINSPFGTVDLNAFTGISINAPNGDITIAGKNINIEARNNLNITSGTTCEDITFRWVMDAITGGAAAFATSVVAPMVLDLQYIRHLVEIFIKPCEGTLSLKSGRNLMLNAGGAYAAIPATGFVVPRGTVDPEKEQRDKVAEVLRALLAIDGAVSSAKHLRKYLRGAISKANAAIIAKLWIKDESGTSKKCLTDAMYDKIADLASKDNGEFVFLAADAAENKVELAFDVDLHLSALVQMKTVSEANGIVEQLRAIRKAIGSGSFKNNNGYSVSFKVDDNAAKTIADKLLERYVDGGQNGVNLQAKQAMRDKLAPILTAMPIGFDDVSIKKTKREMAAEVLKKAKVLNVAGITEGVNKNRGSFMFDYNWGNYVNGSFDKSVAMGKKGHIWESIKVASKQAADALNPVAAITGKFAQGRRVWKAESRGRILMSDTEGTTMYFNNGQLQTFSNTDVRAIKHFCLNRL